MLKQIESIIIETGIELLNFKKNNKIIKKKIKDHIKTNIDIYADEFIKKKLNKITKIPIISEESYKKNLNRPDEYFIIDPIDGTLSLINDYKTWVTQLAYIKKGEVLYSAIYEPENENLYSGSKEQGIFFNHNRIIKKNLNQSDIIFIDNTPQPNVLNSKLMKYYHNSRYSESGSLSLKICKIILGEANIFIKNVKVRDWDIAPTLLFTGQSDIDIFDLKLNNYKLMGSFEKEGLLVCNRELTTNLKKNIIKIFN